MRISFQQVTEDNSEFGMGDFEFWDLE